MGGGSSVEIAHIYTHVNSYDPTKKVLTRVSTFLFGDVLPEVLPPIDENTFTNAPAGAILSSPTGKIGLLLEASLSVDDFWLLFEGNKYCPQCESGGAGVEQELVETFGKPPGLKWSGYTVSLPPPTDRFQMSALLKVNVDFKEKPKGVYHGVYGVPMVFGFYKVPLTEHYALGLTALQPDTGIKVDTSVRLRT